MLSRDGRQYSHTSALVLRLSTLGLSQVFLLRVDFEGFQPLRQLDANHGTSNQPRPCSNFSHATQLVPYPTSLPYRPFPCRPTCPLTRLED